MDAIEPEAAPTSIAAQLREDYAAQSEAYGVETVSSESEVTYETVPLVMINATDGTQMRQGGLNQSRLKDYKEMVEERWAAAERASEQNGTNVLEDFAYPLPPSRFYFDGDRYWPWDGHHRIEVNKQLGIPVIPGEVRPGTRRDAILAACGANEEHGVMRTDADRRKAVVTALQITAQDEIQLSSREIARICRVSHTFVNSVRSALEAAAGYLHPNTEQPTEASLPGDSDPLEDSAEQVETVSTYVEPNGNTAPKPEKQKQKRKGKDGKVQNVTIKTPDQEASLNDEQWLKTLPLRGELRTRKCSTDAFDNDALAWRRLQQGGLVGDMKYQIGKIFDLSAIPATPLEKLMHAAAKLPHPREWRVHQCPGKTGQGCEACGGSGYQFRLPKKGESMGVDYEEE